MRPSAAKCSLTSSCSRQRAGMMSSLKFCKFWLSSFPLDLAAMALENIPQFDEKKPNE